MARTATCSGRRSAVNKHTRARSQCRAKTSANGLACSWAGKAPLLSFQPILESNSTTALEQQQQSQRQGKNYRIPAHRAEAVAAKLTAAAGASRKARKVVVAASAEESSEPSGDAGAATAASAASDAAASGKEASEAAAVAAEQSPKRARMVGEVDEKVVVDGLVAAIEKRIAATQAKAADEAKEQDEDAKPKAAKSKKSAPTPKAAKKPSAITFEEASQAFRSLKAPTLSLRDYAHRLRNRFQCTSECFVLCAAYMDRLDRRFEGLADKHTSHRLLLCSLMLAIKFHDDDHYVNKFYADVGGLSLKEINSLEVLMLQLLDYNMDMNAEEFEMYRRLCSVACASAAEAEEEEDEEDVP